MIPLDWSYRLELPIMRVLGIDLESSEEQPVLFTAEPHLQRDCQHDICKHREIQPWACARAFPETVTEETRPTFQTGGPDLKQQQQWAMEKITEPACFHFFI